MEILPPTPITWSLLGIIATLAAVKCITWLVKAFSRKEFAAAESQLSMAGIAKRLSELNAETNISQAKQIGELMGRIDGLQNENLSIREEIHIVRGDNHNFRNWINAVILIDKDRRNRVQDWSARKGVDSEELGLLLGPEFPDVPEPTIFRIIEREAKARVESSRGDV